MSEPAYAGRRQRDSLLAAMELFRDLAMPQSSNAIILFLYACENEGVNLSELAFVSQLHVATAARLARIMSGEDGTQEALLRFEESPSDRRLKFVHLTARGAAVREQLEGLIARATPIRRGAGSATP